MSDHAIAARVSKIPLPAEGFILEEPHTVSLPAVERERDKEREKKKER